MRPLALALAIAAALLLSGARPAHADDDAVRTALSRAGITAVQPTPAADFELTTLAGEPMSLQAHRGKWVLLTFFATWCGPCAHELPSLQRLHEAVGQDVVFLGVSTDRSPGPVPRFVKSKGVTFPVAVDTRGQVAATYQATAIPFSVLIDHAGRVVGVSRGARPWDRDIGLFQALASGEPPDPSAFAAAPATPPKVVALPPNVAPPTASVSLLAPDAVAPGDPFALEVAVQWAGALRDYLLHPPEVHLPEGVISTGTEARTSSRDGRQVVTYTVGLLAEHAGSFALDPVDVLYTPAGGEEPLAAQVDGVELTVIDPRPPLAALAGAGAVGAVSLIGAGAWVLRRRSKREPPPPPRHARLADALTAARAARTAGDHHAALERLAPILRELGADATELVDAQERVRYGGARIDDATFDLLFRRAARGIDAIQHAAEDPTP